MNAGLIPCTNENYYELAWSIRELFYNNRLAQSQNRDVILDELIAFEVKNQIALGTTEEADDETGETSLFLTGEVQISEVSDVDASDQVDLYIKGSVGRMEFVASHVAEDTQAIIELGCGYGANLFRLSKLLANSKTRYIGAEYTKSGRDLCEKLASLPPPTPIQIEFVDHKQPDLSYLSEFDNILIFTCHSIEQVKYIPENYFDVLSKSAKHVRTVHLEPFGFQLDSSTPYSKQHEIFFKEMGWNLNFYDRLLSARQSGTITIRDTRKDVYSFQGTNPTSVAVWDNEV